VAAVRRVGLAFALTALAAPAMAQVAEPHDQQEFVRVVREATERYRDRSRAIADGYRPIGPDFPGMGEHWISVPLLLRGEVDPARPPILEYATLENEATLVGAAFAVLLKEGEQPPSGSIPVGPDEWHYHRGTVSEESFVASHKPGKHQHASGPAIAVLHVWAWFENPDGPFATDNWALPFARLGLTVPDSAPDSDAWHAVALAAGGDRYYLAFLAATQGTPPDSATRDRLRGTAAVLRELFAQPDAKLDVAAQQWKALRHEVRGLP
jgi:hypothetical protein